MFLSIVSTLVLNLAINNLTISHESFEMYALHNQKWSDLIGASNIPAAPNFLYPHQTVFLGSDAMRLLDTLHCKPESKIRGKWEEGMQGAGP